MSTAVPVFLPSWLISYASYLIIPHHGKFNSAVDQENPERVRGHDLSVQKVPHLADPSSYGENRNNISSAPLVRGLRTKRDILIFSLIVTNTLLYQLCLR